MEEDTIYAQLSGYIAAEILKQPNRVIGRDEPLISSGLVDSFSRVDLSLFIEDTFGVIIDDQELKAETLDTLDNFVTLIISRQK
jgi:acyl carrier protein